MAGYPFCFAGILSFVPVHPADAINIISSDLCHAARLVNANFKTIYIPQSGWGNKPVNKIVHHLHK